MSDIGSSLESLGVAIPEANAISDSYAKIGITEMYEWQSEAIRTPSVSKACNFVYCAPTGGGKTLVAELIMLACALGSRRKAVFIAPYVSL